MVQRLADYWSELVPGYSLNASGLKDLRKLKRQFELDEIMAAMKRATDHYLEFDGKDVLKQDSVEHAFKRIGGICNLRRKDQENPHLQRLYYIRGILRNRLSHLHEGMALQMLLDAVTVGADIDSLQRHAKSVNSWTEWCDDIEDFMHKQGSPPPAGG